MAHMKNRQYLAVAAIASMAATAQAQSVAWRSQAAPDLRSTLKQPVLPAQSAQPRQLSEEERAVLRQQLARPVRHEPKRS